VIGPGTRVRLARKARLRHDRLSGKTMLLYPERGLELSATAAAIAEACAGGGVLVAALIDGLAGRFTGQPRERIEAEAMAFLRALDQRGLLIQEQADDDDQAGGEGAP
jgi:coenzyme PQQ biosynthesis protein PqqD